MRNSILLAVIVACFMGAVEVARAEDISFAECVSIVAEDGLGAESCEIATVEELCNEPTSESGLECEPESSDTVYPDVASISRTARQDIGTPYHVSQHRSKCHHKKVKHHACHRKS